MGTRLLFTLAAVSICSAECRQVGPKEFGRVEVSAFSLLGERLPNLGVDLIEVGTRKSFTSQFHEGLAKKIPYGTYILRVSATSFRTIERELRVQQPEIFVRVQLSVSVECGGYAEIAGSINPAPDDRELWVKLVPLRGAGGHGVRVSRGGSFVASDLDDGQYLVLVVDGKSIIHTETVEVSGSSRLNINLENK